MQYLVLVILSCLSCLSCLSVAAEPVPLEEVLVTAERYQSPLREVPVSVYVVTGESIDQADVKNMSALSFSVPNLVVADGAINTNIYMRGIGSGSNRGFEQSVGMFIDEIYMGRANQYRAPFLDLQQVEVIRGPQGALLGKNTIAGAVVLSTRKPDLDETFAASVSAELEPEQDGKSVTAIVSGALSDQWAARFVNKTASNQGYWHNTFNDDDEIQVDESINRLSLLYQPSDNWRFDAKFEHAEVNSDGSSLQLRELEELTPLSALLQAQMFVVDPQLETELDANKSVDNYGRPVYRNQVTDNALVSAYFEAEKVQVTYTLGYSGFDSDESQDLDYSPLSFVGVDDERDFNQWSQELRFKHEFNASSQFQWGLYWQDQNFDGNFQEHLGLPDIGPVWAGLFASIGIDPTVIPPTPFTRNTSFQQESKTRALFAEWQWQFAERWSLFLGGRYNSESKKYQRVSSQDEFLNPGIPASLPAQVTANVFNVNVLSPAFNDKREENDFLPAVKLWWGLNASTNAYAKIESGAKSGGFNAVADAAPDEQEYEDEQATTFEIGSKSVFFDNTISLNSAIFYTEIDDLQMTVLNDTRFLVGNAAQSISQGVEVDGRWRIDDAWQLSAYGAYLDAFYKDFEDGPCTARKSVAGASTCDLSGATTLFAPEWNAGLQLDYEYGLSAGIDMIAGLGISYSSDYSVNADLDPIDSQAAYTKYDAQLGLRANHWELMLIGKNISDETIVNYGVDIPLVPGGHAAYLAAPRSYVLRLKLQI
jgi:iron complex outermembrane receptor protein